MYTSKTAVKRALENWCNNHQVSIENVVLFGSAALLFHEIVDCANDIDIDIPQADIDRLAQSAIVAPVKDTSFLSMTYLGHDIEHINCANVMPWIVIDGIKVCELSRLYEEYLKYNRLKDHIKLRRICSELLSRQLAGEQIQEEGSGARWLST